ncbi:hypothetical protein [Acidicapsa ligni]|uniref:hypothetical protein n=1 Tax=Acidicapsa ligni TaxID=542300 RepID=UPI0021DF96A5|nr:hypothetical protein [Acidicapsa ligni]
MQMLKYLAVVVLGAGVLLIPLHKADAQISVSIGAAPVCPYGYYDYSPYSCTPDGYYGPEWFSGGRFVGAGPWFHGPKDFHGHVDNKLDVSHGYKGHLPARGEHPFAKTNDRSR